MSEYVRFIQRIGLVGLTNILISLSSLIFIPIITKSFTTAEYGMWAQVNTTIALVPNIANLGLPYTMVRFLSAEKDKEKIKDSFYPMISLTFISGKILSTYSLVKIKWRPSLEMSLIMTQLIKPEPRSFIIRLKSGLL